MTKIFISYRRDDSQYPANRLYNALKPYVANPKTDLFIDIDNIPAGVDFARYLRERVAECDVLLAVIGHDWLDARDAAGGRRLDDPADFVRIEIAAALDRRIPMVPVLLDGAPVPGPSQLPAPIAALSGRNRLPLNLQSFETDVARLVARLPVKLAGNGPAERAGLGFRVPATETPEPSLQQPVASSAGLGPAPVAAVISPEAAHPSATTAMPVPPTNRAAALISASCSRAVLA